MVALGREPWLFEPRPGGVVSLEPQPFLQCHPSAPKTQWVMVVAHRYRYSGWLEPMRLVRGSFKGKGAVGGVSPFPVADSPETTPPVLGSNSLWLRLEVCIGLGFERSNLRLIHRQCDHGIRGSDHRPGINQSPPAMRPPDLSVRLWQSVPVQRSSVS